MEKPCLSDENSFPNRSILAAHLGQAIDAWDAFLEALAQESPPIEAEWRYYRDGKSWLCKVTRKKKTVCWVSVWPGRFRAAFYFTEKARAVILGSALPEDLKQQFTDPEPIGKLKPIQVCVAEPTDLAALVQLIEIKKKT